MRCFKMEKSPVFKICVFGNSGVGKSTLISKYFKESNIKGLTINPKDAIGVVFYQGTINVDGIKVILHIWEISGKDRFPFLFEQYVKGVAGGIFIYDITDELSLKNAKDRIKTIRRSKIISNLPILMVGNKADLEEERKISLESANKCAKSHNMIGVIETSAKSEYEPIKIFEAFARLILQFSQDKQIIDTFKKELNLRILILLSIYKELSLTEISYHLGKSKATISRHTRDLIKLNLIDSKTKDNELQPGTIKRKYYLLNQNFKSLITRKDFETGVVKDMLGIIAKKTYISKKLNLIATHILRYLEEIEISLLTGVAIESLPILEPISLFAEVIEQISIYFRFLTLNQYKKVQTLSYEFHKKLDEVLKEDDGSKKSFLFIDISLNMERINRWGDDIDKISRALRSPEMSN